MDISFVDLLAGNLYVSRLRRDDNMHILLNTIKKLLRQFTKTLAIEYYKIFLLPMFCNAYLGYFTSFNSPIIFQYNTGLL